MAPLQRMLDRYVLWRARRRYLKNKRWQRRHAIVKSSPDPKCIVHNFREGNCK